MMVIVNRWICDGLFYENTITKSGGSSPQLWGAVYIGLFYKYYMEGPADSGGALDNPLGPSVVEPPLLLKVIQSCEY